MPFLWTQTLLYGIRIHTKSHHTKRDKMRQRTRKEKKREKDERDRAQKVQKKHTQNVKNIFVYTLE